MYGIPIPLDTKCLYISFILTAILNLVYYSVCTVEGEDMNDVLLILDTGEIRHYIKLLKELDISKIKDKREADRHLIPHIPVRLFIMYMGNNRSVCALISTLLFR